MDAKAFCLEEEIRFLLLVFLASYQLFPLQWQELGVKQALLSLLKGVGETPAAGHPPRGHSKAQGR